MSLSSILEEYTEARIDFVGQQLVEKLSKIVLVAATAISFVIGFVLQSLQTTFAIFAAAVILLALVVLPPWPIYKRDPVRWLPVEGDKKT